MFYKWQKDNALSNLPPQKNVRLVSQTKINKPIPGWKSTCNGAFPLSVSFSPEVGLNWVQEIGS